MFNQLIAKLSDLKEINFENIFIDGTKIEANANRYSFVWKKSIDKFERKLQEKTLELINKISDEFNVECNLNTDKLSIDIGSSVFLRIYDIINISICLRGIYNV